MHTTCHDHVRIGPGTIADYHALAAHHYRADRPATLSRILAAHTDAPSVIDRFVQRTPTPRPVAVLVESRPALSCRLREVALANRYGSLPAGQRAALLNREMRTISRVIVHPQHRGRGLAVRLVREALRTATTTYTEALAAMGHVSPFFERAGMTAYRRPPLPRDQRLLDAFEHVGVDPADLASPLHVADRMLRLPEAPRRFMQHELHRWRRDATRQPDTHTLATLKLARDRLGNPPVYYLAMHPYPHPPAP